MNVEDWTERTFFEVVKFQEPGTIGVGVRLAWRDAEALPAWVEPSVGVLCLSAAQARDGGCVVRGPRGV